MNNCTQCGSPIPEGQSICSMCYGDLDYGKDGYYREYMEEWERSQREQERANQPDQKEERE